MRILFFLAMLSTGSAHADETLDHRLYDMPVLRAIDLVGMESPSNSVLRYRDAITIRIPGISRLKLVIEPAMLGGFDPKSGGTLVHKPRAALVWDTSTPLGFGIDVRDSNRGGTECMLRISYKF